MRRILEALLHRLLVGLFHGPAMVARCHQSNQRVDILAIFNALQAPERELALSQLFSGGRLTIPASVPPFQMPDSRRKLTAAEKAQQKAWDEQEDMLDRLRLIHAEARDYLKDHGEPCLAVGHPLVSIPPNAALPGRVQNSGRVLAPLLFMPVSIEVNARSVNVVAAHEGRDRHLPNPALLAWLERLEDSPYEPLGDDQEGAGQWWTQAGHLLRWVQQALGIKGNFTVTQDGAAEPVPATDELGGTPRVLPSAVLGLFPLTHHAVIQDMRWMLKNTDALTQPVTPFLQPKALELPPEGGDGEAPTPAASSATSHVVDHAREYLVDRADPCQRRAVREAQDAPVLVIHGPPGTGKSQTIANLIGDHLARGQRVLFVCDKITAIEEVRDRLHATGLGDLCARVFDPARDRRTFYTSLRERLDNLGSAPLPTDPTRDLATLNEQMNQAQRELAACRELLHANPKGVARSFHDHLGEWLELFTRLDHHTLPEEAAFDAAMLDRHRAQIEELWQRADVTGGAANPFLWHLELTPAKLRRTSVESWEENLGRVHAQAQAADALAPEGVPSFKPEVSFGIQAGARREAARLLGELSACECMGWVRRLALMEPDALRSLKTSLEAAAPATCMEMQRPLIAEFACTIAAPLPTPQQVNHTLDALAPWCRASRFFLTRWLAGARRKAALEVLTPAGVALEAAPRALAFLAGLRDRLILADILREHGASITDVEIVEGTAIHRLAAAARTVIALRVDHEGDAAWKPLLPFVHEMIEDSSAMRDAAPRLVASAAHAEALAVTLEKAAALKLLTQEHLTHLAERWCGEEPASLATGDWVDQAASLEDVARLQAAHAALPVELRDAVRQLLDSGATLDSAQASLRCHVLGRELRDRFERDERLSGIDVARMAVAFQMLLDGSRRKVGLVRQAILRRWLLQQQERLIDPVRRSLSEAGSALKKRLKLTGKNALKFRQMLEMGAGTEGGDPVYDMCPVWMASPTTVAQIFPRRVLFDVIIFDEASQCRLEHALPALLRARRVVIAGDPKQMPPTNFFRAAGFTSAPAAAGAEDDDSDEARFAWLQSEAEDLLTAALNLHVREAYLDIHYRSRNAALIAFSNQHYYQQRLQPHPAHPRHRVKEAPIQVHQIDGTYTAQTNVAEAEAVAAKVADLLAGSNAPSIGIVCFNLPQCRAILKALDKRAASDESFARLYRAAQDLRGADGSFQGLFVKNLENAQGAQRDVMLVSTTFGRTSEGRFIQNFGALTQRGGERRLNVLITRARDAVHVFTSIPREKYLAADADSSASQGRRDLYAYLRRAGDLKDQFERMDERLAQARCDEPARVTVLDTGCPSRAAKGLAHALHAQHGIGSTVHWGSDGFAVDVACTPPGMAADVTIGVLTDFSRYLGTDDPVGWDVFRTLLLESQGWKLQRVWTPQLLWRHKEQLQALARAHDAQLQEAAVAQED